MGLIRILLAITVVVGHSGSTLFGYTFVGGSIAVQTFYIISGFYMALILNEKYTGKKSYSLFITNRFLRLYPVYWIVLFLSLIMVVFSIATEGIKPEASLYKYTQEYAYIPKISTPILVLLVVVNVAIFFTDTIMFLGVNLTKSAHRGGGQNIVIYLSQKIIMKRRHN